jgi:hypothetical protein
VSLTLGRRRRGIPISDGHQVRPGLLRISSLVGIMVLASGSMSAPKPRASIQEQISNFAVAKEPRRRGK